MAMVPLTAAPQFQAELVVARLGAEGIVAQLRGQSSIYPFGTVQVMVEEAELGRAREILAESDSFEANGPTPMPDRERLRARSWLVVLVAVGLLTALTMRAMAGF